MVLVGTTQQFFQPAEPPDSDWHINTTQDRSALCGVVAMRYNVDNTADALPSGARLCGRCDGIANGKPETVSAAITAEAVIEKPAPKPRRKPKSAG